MTTVCCKCLKTKTNNGWRKITPKNADMLSHGYCPTCHGKEIKKLQNYRHQTNHA